MGGMWCVGTNWNPSEKSELTMGMIMVYVKVLKTACSTE